MKKIFFSIIFIMSFVLFAVYQNGTTQSAALVTDISPTSGVSTVTKTVTATSVPPPTKAVAVSQGKYKDGTYTGSSADAYYGLVQVQVKIASGKIADVSFLNYPQDRGTSRSINSYAMPQLTQEAIQAQSANVSGVSGASDTSAAFRQSLASALSKAA